jgi:hypothetical protein
MHSDRGLWQISSWWWSEYPDRRTDDPAEAAEIVFELSERGTDFTPWDSFLSGSAEAHFDRAFDGWPALRPVVTEFLQELEDDEDEVLAARVATQNQAPSAGG